MRLPLACGERDVKRTTPLLTEETMAKKGNKGERRRERRRRKRKEGWSREEKHMK